MANLFFSFPGELAEATQTVFGILGAAAAERNSANVLGGSYATTSFLGFKIKLEPNAYDYEDQYNYMLSVNEDYLAGLRVNDETAEELAGIIAKVLSQNVPFAIAQEQAENLVVYPARNA